MTPEEKAKQIAEIERRLQIMDQEDGIESLGQSVEDAAISGGKHALKGLDYQRGAAQQGLLSALGKEDLLTPEERAAALDITDTRMAPGYNEVMKRAGVPEGASLSDVLPPHLAAIYAQPGEGSSWRPEKGGMLDPSLRGSVGLAADVAGDPLTWESFGGAPLARLVKMLGGSEKIQALLRGSGASRVLEAQGTRAAERGNLGKTLKDRFKDAVEVSKKPFNVIGAPTRNAAEYLGNAAYRSAMKPLDRTAVEASKRPFSELAVKEGVKSGWNSMEEQLRALREAAGSKARGTAEALEALDPLVVPEPSMYGVSSGSKSGGTDMRAAMERTQAPIARMDQRPEVAELQAALKQRIKEFEDLGRVTRPKALQNKSDLYAALPDNAWMLDSRVSPGGGVRKQAARGIKEEVTKLGPAAQGNKAAEKLAMELDPQMENWGRHLDVQDDIARLSKREANTPALTKGEIYQGTTVNALGGSGLGVVAAKKGAQAAVGTPARTYSGWALDRYAKSLGGAPASFADGSLRQNVLLDLMRQQQAAGQEEIP